MRSLQVCRTCLSLFLICASMTKDEQGRNRRTTSSLCWQCCSGRLLATRATGHNLGGQMRLLAISHLALTMQFPLNCKVHTAKCEGEGGSASGDMLKTIVEEHTHTHTQAHSHSGTHCTRLCFLLLSEDLLVVCLPSCSALWLLPLRRQQLKIKQARKIEKTCT